MSAATCSEIMCSGCREEFKRSSVAFVPQYKTENGVMTSEIIRSLPFCWKCLTKWRGIAYRDGKPEMMFK